MLEADNSNEEIELDESLNVEFEQYVIHAIDLEFDEEIDESEKN